LLITFKGWSDFDNYWHEDLKKNAIVEYLDYQIPVPQQKGQKGNRDMQAEKKDSMRHQKKFFLSSTKMLGATGATVWALKWAWHSAETNLRCVRSSGICMPSPNSLAFIVSEISAFIRTDRQTDIRRWLDRLG